MRYKVYLEDRHVLDGSLLAGQGEFLGETENFHHAQGIAISTGIPAGFGSIVFDTQSNELWWYDQDGTQQYHGPPLPSPF